MSNDTQTEPWTADQHYARGMADALGQTYTYLLHHGVEDLAGWLKRRERGFMALLPTDQHGNTQFSPECGCVGGAHGGYTCESCRH